MEVEDADNGHHHHHHHHVAKRSRMGGVNGVGMKDAREEGEGGGSKEVRRLGSVPWQHPSSRIYRVSRASGGKDRHSKVYTAKGIRDRRVRLSVSTAIQFYDLQDRLGYDQPSKAIEWLIKAASAAIDKLPSLDGTFPDGPKPLLSDDKLGVADADGGWGQQLTKSGCSSTSETSKGSVLSLSRSENRVKARERARERSAAKDKEADDGRSSAATAHRRAIAGGGHHNASTSAQTASFTELLTGMAAASSNGPTVAATTIGHSEHKQSWQLPAAAAANDYLGFVQSRKAGQAMPPSFSSPTAHFGGVAPLGMAPAPPFNFTAAAGEQHPEMTHFSFLQEHFMPVNAVTAAASAPAGDLNFSISSGLVGVNRGTLQSNSQSHFSNHQQLQRLSTPLDAQNIPFFFSPAAAAAPAAAESQFSAAAAFQLWDGFRHSDMKEKGKN